MAPLVRADTSVRVDAGPDPDTPALHAVLTDWMRGGISGRETLAAAMARPLAGNLPASTALVAIPGHPWTDALKPLGVPTHHAAPDRHARAAAIQQALNTMR